jgi:hypothetical protein
MGGSTPVDTAVKDPSTLGGVASKFVDAPESEPASGDAPRLLGGDASAEGVSGGLFAAPEEDPVLAPREEPVELELDEPDELPEPVLAAAPELLDPVPAPESGDGVATSPVPDEPLEQAAMTIAMPEHNTDFRDIRTAECLCCK